MKKSILALALSLCLILGMLAGCGSTADSAGASQVGSSETASAQETAEAPAAEAPAEAEPAADAAPAAEEETSALEEASVAEEAPVVELPPYEVSPDMIEVSMLFQYMPFFQGFFPQGWGSSPWWEAFEEATNSNWTLREVSGTAWQENVNLLCASGDLPDVVSNLGNVYSGGLSQAIRDEQIIDLAPLLEDSAPYYLQKLTQDDYTVKSMLTDDGEMGAMSALVDTPQPVTNGLWIRQDWLDKVGQDIPTTPEDLKKVLEDFRDTCGADLGFFQMVRADNTTVGVTAEGVWNAFGPTDFFLDENGDVQYGPMQDYYYDYMAYLKSLAQEGLFLSSQMTDKKTPELVSTGAIGLMGDSPDNLTGNLALLPEEEQKVAKMVPMAALGEPTEYMPNATYASGANGGGGAISISTNCENPEAVLHAIDYLFTEDGAVLSSYGIEGTSYEINAEGKPQLNDMILHNPDGIPSAAAMGYWTNPGLPGLMDSTRSQVAWDDTQKSAIGVWESAYTGDSMTLPTGSLSFTEEETDSISVYKSDMVTYATQWFNDVVFGDVELNDETIADFQKTMTDTMHIQDIIDVYTAAYERFQERSFG